MAEFEKLTADGGPGPAQGLCACASTALDEKLLELISERARCAQDVARVKTQTLGEGEAPVFYRPEREAWVLKHIMQLEQGAALDNEEVARLFR